MNHRPPLPRHVAAPCLLLLALSLAAPAPVLADPQPPATAEADTAPAPPSSGPTDLSALDRLLAEIARGPGVPPALDAAPTPDDPAVDPGVGAAPWPSSSEAAALADALAEYVETGEPPILGLPTSRVVPHGHEVPVVRCLPLRACDLVFEAGEQLAGWALGDSERWLAEQLTEGRGAAARAHLLLKPVDFEIATNLVVITDRRSYRLELESPGRDEVHDDAVDGPLAAYDGRVSWWYPDELVHRVRSRDTATVQAAERAEADHRRAVSLDRGFDPDELSFDYELRQPWRRSRRLPWTPVTVFDDGRQVYVRLPEAARRSDLPVVLGLLDDGGHYPLNARLDGDWLIVPTLFARAQLLLGTGDEQRRLTVVAGAEAR